MVAINSMGKNESNIGIFKTKIPEGGMQKIISFFILGFTQFYAVTGPPLNFVIVTRSRYLNLTWSRPVINFPQFNGITITYLVYCNIGGSDKRVETNVTSILISGLPGQQYTCNVSAVSNNGSEQNPTRAINGVTNQDGNIFIQCILLVNFVPSIVAPVVVAVHSNVMVVRDSNAVIQFTIKVADPLVKVDDISWSFLSSSGISSSGMSSSGMSSSGMSSSLLTNTTTLFLSADRLTLTINEAQLNNTGIYTITVRNIAGSHSESVYLKVLGKHHTFIVNNTPLILIIFSSSKVVVYKGYTGEQNRW